MSERERGATDGEPADVVMDRTRRFLDYLGALAREVKKKSTPRDVRQSPGLGKPLWCDSVPNHQGVVLGPGESRPAWLTVRKVQEPARPELPSELDGHVDLVSLEDLERGPRQTVPEPTVGENHDVQDAEDIEAWEVELAVAAETDPAPTAQELLEAWRERQRLLQTWTEQVWQPWTHKLVRAREARQLYDQLFTLHLRLRERQATHELTWGHSLLGWAVSGQTVLSPMLTTRMTIQSDERDGTLRVLPEQATELELEALDGLGIAAVTELANLRESLRGTLIDPWMDGVLEPIHESLLAPLGLDARLHEGGMPPTPQRHPVLTPGWVLYARERPMRQERFYRELAEVIEDKHFIPEGVAAIVADEDTIGNRSGRAEDARRGWRGVAEEPLLPLASNADQERIVRQLGRGRGVTVQGPPGTGKTHTIANLVSHLVAHGKRVLVTAHKEQALEVLQDKIPEELRKLSVAALGSSPQEIDQLRASAQAMTDIVSGLDEEREARRVVELRQQVADLRLALRQADRASIEAMQSESREFPLADGPAKAGEVAKWLHQNASALGIIPDPIAGNLALPLREIEAVELNRLCRELQPVDVAELRLSRPAVGDLPIGSVLDADHTKLVRLRDRLADLEAEGIDLTGIDALDERELASLSALAEDKGDALAGIEEPWLLKVRADVRGSSDLMAYWTEQVQRLRESSSRLVTLRRWTVGNDIQVPGGDPRTQNQLLDQLEARISRNKGVPKLFGGGLREFHQQVRVDGGDIRTTEEVNLVRHAIELRTRTASVIRHLTQLADESGLSVPAPDGAFVPAVSTLVQQLERALDWERQEQAETLQRLRRALPHLPAVVDSAVLNNAARLLSDASERRQERELDVYLSSFTAYLDTTRLEPNASGLCSVLYSAFTEKRWDDWDAALAECSRLAVLAPDLERRDDLLARLAERAPQWADQLASGGTDLAAHRWVDAWRWSQADTWLKELAAAGSLAKWQRQRESVQTQLSTTVTELARTSAEIALKHNLRDTQRRALTAWLNALGKVGKGTGKHAAHWQQVARQELPEAMNAVPIWIMPIHRVMDNFDPRRSELFDVVIVDESSQCDLLSVGVLALGRKVVVVGDDRQTSPSGVGVLRDNVIRLQQTYLDDIPQNRLLTVDESLYGVAERAYGDVIMLREHFRCVPEIIEFSNRYYDGGILPLREKTYESIGPALRAVHVPDGARVGSGNNEVNLPEATALVNQLVQCANDPEYDGLTFGVVVLQGHGQTAEIQRQLKERLGFENYERLDLRVGDPADFQGDERDVIFISVFADDNRAAATTTQHKQRMNVAASRARDQLWVFHTVDPAALHAEDQRKALIEYVRDGADRQAEAAGLRERCDSEFERDVLDQLLSRGYRTTVQHKVGAYRIDLVVHGEKDRLAVECDGDSFHGIDRWENDLRRQAVLERLGWKFWRVLASTWYRSPAEAFAALVTRLEQLGIKPMPAQPAPQSVPPVRPAVPPTRLELPSGPGFTSSPVLKAPDTSVVTAANEPPSALEATSETPRSPVLARASGPTSTPASSADLVSRPTPTPGPDDEPAHHPAEVLVMPALTPAGKAASLMPTPAPAFSAPALFDTDEALFTDTLAIEPGPRPAVLKKVSARVAPTPARKKPDAADPAIVPPGFRMIAWIRPHEAATAQKAHQGRVSAVVSDPDGNAAGMARYHPDESPDARRYRSNVELVRASGPRQRTVAWLKEHEADAIVEAAEAEQDVTVLSATGQVDALVQYFAPESAEAKKYRSVTRLLRRNKGSQEADSTPDPDIRPEPDTEAPDESSDPDLSAALTIPSDLAPYADRIHGNDPRFSSMIPYGATLLEAVTGGFMSREQLATTVAKAREILARRTIEGQARHLIVAAHVRALGKQPSADWLDALAARYGVSGQVSTLEEAGAMIGAKGVTRERVRQVTAKVSPLLVKAWLPALEEAAHVLVTLSPVAPPIGTELEKRALAAAGMSAEAFLNLVALVGMDLEEITGTHLLIRDEWLVDVREESVTKAVRVAEKHTSTYGMTTVEEIRREVSTAENPQDADDVTRVLETDPRVRWAGSWLWVEKAEDSPHANSMINCLRNMLSVNAPLNIASLHEGLSRAQRFRKREIVPTQEAMLRFVEQSPYFSVTGTRVSPVRPLDYHHQLGPVAASVVDVLKASPYGAMDRVSFSQACDEAGIAKGTYSAWTTYAEYIERVAPNVLGARGVSITSAAIAEIQNAAKLRAAAEPRRTDWKRTTDGQVVLTMDVNTSSYGSGVWTFHSSLRQELGARRFTAFVGQEAVGEIAISSEHQWVWGWGKAMRVLNVRPGDVILAWIDPSANTASIRKGGRELWNLEL